MNKRDAIFFRTRSAATRHARRTTTAPPVQIMHLETIPPVAVYY